MSRRVEKNYAPFFIRIIRALHLDAVRADVLSDAAGFSARDVRGANGIEERSLAVVDVAHDGDDGRAWHLYIIGIGGDQFFELFFRNHVLEWNKGHVIAEPLAEIDCDIIVECLIDRGENAALQQQAHHFLRFNAELFGELFDRRALNQTYRF